MNIFAWKIIKILVHSFRQQKLILRKLLAKAKSSEELGESSISESIGSRYLLRFAWNTARHRIFIARSSFLEKFTNFISWVILAIHSEEINQSFSG